MENTQTKKTIKGNKKLIIAGLIGLLIVGGIVVSQFCCSSGGSKVNVSAPVVRSKNENAVIVALIGKEQVTMNDLENVKNSIPQIKDMPMDAALYNRLLEAYVNNKVVLNAAKNAQVAKDPAVQKTLEDSQNQIILQAYLTRQLRQRATPEALQAVYDKMMESYVPEEEIHARHILVATEKEAKDLIIKLKAGAKFEDLANKYTKDNNPGGNNGGDLGYFKKRTMIPEFANAAFAIKAGKISEKPVKTPFGWHVIKVEDRRQAQKPSLNEVMEEVQARFTEEMVPVIIAEEVKKANVTKLDPLGLNRAAQEAQASQAAKAADLATSAAQPVAQPAAK